MKRILASSLFLPMMAGYFFQGDKGAFPVSTANSREKMYKHLFQYRRNVQRMGVLPILKKDCGYVDLPGVQQASRADVFSC